MKVLIATMPFAGHINPTQPIARALVRRGHTVAWLTSASHEHLTTPTGANFIPSPSTLAHHDETPLSPDPGTSGLTAIVSTLRKLFLDRVPDQVAAYRSVLETFDADILLVDLTAYGAHCLRDLTGLPYATLGINPLVTLDAEVPPWGTGWLPPRTFFGRWVNGLAHAAAGRLLYPKLTAALNNRRQEMGLPPLPATGFFDSARSDTLHIMPTTPAFEFPRKNLHPGVKFVGPLLPLFNDEEFSLPTWWGEMLTHPREKVIHVTQGTYATNSANLIAPTLAALGDHEDLLVMVTTPDAETVLPPETLPSNARVASFIPHAKLLPHVGVMVTNAGYNGVLVALSCGVPMVCAGRSEDKADVSSRVAWSGAGIDLATDTPSEKALRGAVERVISDEKFRRAAERIRDDFGKHNAPEEAVDALEQLVEKNRS
ncbi:4'-demethylrebeccamycin synthase [Colletotrichum spaethianum]|uniref:4'-demethylrebeccamycin synthase n=1 Tax=Colletotrichum spaethianum TaxID=700344 RepID=A0AA37L1J0_9PEZI|nr:4'-demethylrebeccamycin synthase [Colletotrichum spaethianum]GKT40256.1 4'-demethylrebeccamycin synthase [Colletotrichum spaethianum]